MSRVFVVQRQQRWDAQRGEMVDRFQFGPATEYGTVVFCLNHRDNPLQGEAVVARLRESLLDYDPEQDYLLPVGNPCLIGAATAVATAVGSGKIRLLQWDKRYQTYDVVVLDFSG